MEGIESIYNYLKEKVVDGVGLLDLESKDPWFEVKKEKLRDIARILKDDPELGFSYLVAVTGVDYSDFVDVEYKGKLCATYILYRLKDSHQLIFKVFTEKEDPRIPSVWDIWRAAEWHEREAYDLVGIEFIEHPDLRRILLPPEWEGYPLRKDYKEPEEYKTPDGYLVVKTHRPDPLREKNESDQK